METENVNKTVEAGPRRASAPGSAIDATIIVKAYRDSKGNPTCARNFETGEVCIFYRTQRFGCHETCVFGDTESKYMKSLKRRDGGNGSLIPLACCPVWPTVKPSGVGISEFDKCVIKTRRGRAIRCRLGLWGVSAGDKATAEREARHYWKQYYADGEYAAILSNDQAHPTAAKASVGGTENL